MRYDAFELLVAPARASAHPLRLVGGLVLTILLFLTLAIGFSDMSHALLGPVPREEVGFGVTPVAALLLLAEFGLMIAALAVTLRVVHHRALSGLLGPPWLALAQFRRGTRALLPIFLLFALWPGPAEYQLTLHTAPLTWLLVLPAALILILVQISAEELLFRGYLQSHLAARFSSPLVWILVPSLLFGLIHYDTETAGPNAGLLVIWATLFGVAAADLTARAGTLGPALALHFVNNVFAILIAAPQGNFDGLALYTYPLILSDPMLPWYVLPTELVFTFCGWLILRLSLRV